jgi:HSP20 family protein
VDAERVRANYVNGVLPVTMPKVEEAKPRRIQIEGGGEGRRIEAGRAS